MWRRLNYYYDWSVVESSRIHKSLLSAGCWNSFSGTGYYRKHLTIFLFTWNNVTRHGFMYQNRNHFQANFPWTGCVYSILILLTETATLIVYMIACAETGPHSSADHLSARV